MDPIAAKYIGAGIASIGLGLSAIAVGMCGKAALNNSIAFKKLPKRLLVGLYVTTSFGLLCSGVVFLLLFAL
jgi:F-type H+-transporting ATPase subunit c